MSGSSVKQRAVAAPTVEEQQAFLRVLHELEPKSAILTATIINVVPSGSPSVRKWLPPTILSVCGSMCCPHLAGEELKVE